MNKQSLNISFVSIGTFLLFVLLTFLVRSHLLDQFDFNMTVKLQNDISRRFDTFLSLFSLLGSFEIITVVLIAILFLRKKISGVMSLVMFGAGGVIEFFGKFLLDHPGPPFKFFRYDLGFLFPSSYIQAGSSYPSGHSFRTVFVLVIILYFLSRSKFITHETKLIAWAAAFVVTCLVLVSRVSLGEHWATDVIGGTLLALSFSTAYVAFDLNLKKNA